MASDNPKMTSALLAILADTLTCFLPGHGTPYYPSRIAGSFACRTWSGVFKSRFSSAGLVGMMAAAFRSTMKMNTADTTIACIGGIDIDRKARVADKARPGTSNPVNVTSCPGGVVGNIARSLARLGCRVSLFSILGNDAVGDRLLRDLESDGVDPSAVARSANHPTASYTAVLEPDGQLFIGLADMDVFEELDPDWSDRIVNRIAQCSLWIVDTNLPAPTIERLLKTHKGNATVLVDPISIAKSVRIRSALGAVDVLFPNRNELAELTCQTVKTRDEITRAAAEIRRLGVGTVVVTLGEDGVYLNDVRGGRFLPAIPAESVRDVTGAGDALVAGYAYGLIAAENHEPALYGLAAASLTLETDQSVAADLNPERLRQRIESSIRLNSTRSRPTYEPIP
jgi:pseudouridine kinase